MNVTPRNLFQAAGVAAAAAGAIFIGVQINHPGFDTFLTDTNDWVLRCSAKGVMSVLALAGITGMYLRQVRQVKVLGLVGYVVFALAYLMMWATQVVVVAFLPALTDKAPTFASDVVVKSGGGPIAGDIGHVGTFLAATGVCYMLGGLLFGIALFRAGILARWAAILLAVGTVATAALAVLPAGFDRPMAVPEGIAMIGLGVSLWRDQRHASDALEVPAAAPETALASVTR